MHTSYRILERSRHSSFYDWVVPNLVLRTVGVMYLAHREFEAFTPPALDLTLFVELMVFLRVARSYCHSRVA
jgi:hypothetical protein